MWDKIPNAAIERQIHKNLKTVGILKKNYRLTGIELVAIERPGWKQIFRFEMSLTNPAGGTRNLIGIISDDHRSGDRFELCENEAAFQHLLAEWGAGMILRRVSQHQQSQVVGVIGLCLLLLILITAIVLFNP